MPLAPPSGWRLSLCRLGSVMHPACLLGGLAAAWQLAGLTVMFCARTDPLPATMYMCVVVSLLAAAAAPRVARRLLSAFNSAARRRTRQSPTADQEPDRTLKLLTFPRERDGSLQWTLIGTLAAVIGINTLVILVLMRPFGRAFAAILEHFLWTDLSLAAAYWLAAVVIFAGLWLQVGMLAILLISLPDRREITSTARYGARLAELLLGVGVGWLTFDLLAGYGLSGPHAILMGSLALFALGMLGTHLSHRAQRLASSAPPSTGPRPADEFATPELAAAGGNWIWLALVVWGLTAAWSVTGLLSCRQSSLAHLTGPWLGGGAWMLGIAVGAALASVHVHRRQLSAGGCGMALWIAGIGVGLAVSLAAIWPTSLASTLLQCLLLSLPAGHALGYTEAAWRRRATSELGGVAQLITALACSAAIGVIAGHWWLRPTLGPLGLLCAASLLALAGGGLIQIYDQAMLAHTRRLRLGLVFASLALVSVILPASTGRWSEWAVDLRISADQHVAALPEELSGDARRPCIISPVAAHAYAGATFYRLALPGRLDPASDLSDEELAFRRFGLSGVRYDFVYQYGPPLGILSRCPEYAAEWLGRLAHGVIDGGQVVLDVPLARASSETIRTLVATCVATMGPQCTWQLHDARGSLVLRLRVCPRPLPAAFRKPAPDEWPIQNLLSDGAPPRLHSWQQDRLSRTLVQGSEEILERTADWLDRLATTAAAATVPTRAVLSDSSSSGSRPE